MDTAAEKWKWIPWEVGKSGKSFTHLVLLKQHAKTTLTLTMAPIPKPIQLILNLKLPFLLMQAAASISAHALTTTNPILWPLILRE